MASISTDGSGNRTIQFTGRDRKRRTIRLGAMPMKATRTIKTKVEALNFAAIAGTSPEPEVAEWLAGRDAWLYDKLADVGLAPKRGAGPGVLLGDFLDEYIASRSDVKGATATVYGHTRRNLIEYFGANKPIRDVTPGEADEFRRYLGRPKSKPNSKLPSGEGLADNTVRRRCAIAKQFFRAAKRQRLIGENPFGDMKGIGVRENRAREFFIARESAAKVLDACPDAEWRCIFALARYGGLRVPSELLALRWADVDWERSRMLVHSPKTAHHDGGEDRWVPIFAELRPYLDAVWHSAPAGAEFVVNRYRDPGQNLRTTLEKIVRNAGLTPWPKLFQNLRASRATELAEVYPGHVAAAWLGHTEAIANKHYRQVTEEHFAKACSALQNPVQSGAESTGTGEKSEVVHPPGKSESLENFRVIPNVTAPLLSIDFQPVGGEGLEPPTSTV